MASFDGIRHKSTRDRGVSRVKWPIRTTICTRDTCFSPPPPLVNTLDRSQLGQARLAQISAQLDGREQSVVREEHALAARREELLVLQQKGADVTRALQDVRALGDQTLAAAHLAADRVQEDARTGRVCPREPVGG